MLSFLRIRYLFLLGLIFFGLFQTIFSQKSWYPVEEGLDATVYTLKFDLLNQSLIVGGAKFNKYSSTILEYNGVKFQAMDIGLGDATTTGFERYKDTLYTIGHTLLFDSIFGIAFWNGNYWVPFNNAGKFFQLSVMREILSYNDKLFVIGDLSHTSDQRIKDITYYENGKWNYIGNYTGVVGWMNSMCTFNNKLYVGGVIDTLGTVRARNFIVYNNFSWSVGATNDIGEILTLEPHNDTLYAGTDSGMLYYLDSTLWVKIAVTDGKILDMKSTEEGLVIGGGFTDVNGSKVSAIARINGSVVEDFDGGLSGAVFVLEMFENDLFVGGKFTDTTGENKNNIARWGLQIGLDELERENSMFQISPNPSNGNLTISSRGREPIEVIIYNIQGKALVAYELKKSEDLSVQLKFASGMYFVKGLSESSSFSRKLIIQ